MRYLTGEMILNLKLVSWPGCCDDWCDGRDSTLEALSDGLYVSPAIETADYHASLNKNSWFYVFDYQSKYGDYTTVSQSPQLPSDLIRPLSHACWCGVVWCGVV